MYKNSIIVENFKSIFKICPIKKIQFYNSEITLIVQTKDIQQILLFFKNHIQCQYKILTCISGVDFPESPYRFAIVYDLLSVRYNTRLRIKIYTFELGDVNSIISIFSAAGWFESEIWDMFGVFFKNHKNLKRILTDYGFQGYPLRKDFPLSGYIEMRYNETQKRVINESMELSQEYRTYYFNSPWRKRRNFI
jgi:NADH dehydrogenase (ubiquinone) Fe-S protein 3